MPEQEMFEKRCNVATFFYLVPFIPYGNFFAVLNNSIQSQIEPHVLIYFLFVCAQWCGMS